MMEGTDEPTVPMGQSALEESFCIVDRDSASAMTSSSSGAATVPTSSMQPTSTPPSQRQTVVGANPSFSNSPPVLGGGGDQLAQGASAAGGSMQQNQYPHQEQYHPSSTYGQASTATMSAVSTPQRHRDTMQAPPQPGPPLSYSAPPATNPNRLGSGSAGSQRMSALRAKPHSATPAAINTPLSAYGQAPAAPYGGPGAGAGAASTQASGYSVQPSLSSQPPSYGFNPMPSGGPAAGGAPGGGYGNTGYGGGGVYDQQSAYHQQQQQYAGGPASDETDAGLWGWVTSTTNSVMESASKMVNHPDLLVEGATKLGRNIVDKTKSSVDNVLNTLDPGMSSSSSGASRSSHDYATPGAALIQAKQLILTTDKLPKIDAVKTGFQRCFQSVYARGFICPSGVAPQPFGLQACYHGAQQRIQYLRSMHGNTLGDAILIGMETCIAELLPGCFFDVACLVLLDPTHDITLQALTQPTPIPPHYVESLRAANPPNYAQSDTGFATRWPALLSQEMVGCDQADPHRIISGTSRYRLLETAASSLARAYELQMQKWTSPLASTGGGGPEPGMHQALPPPPQASSAAVGGMYSGAPQASSAPPMSMPPQRTPQKQPPPPQSAAGGLTSTAPPPADALKQSPYRSTAGNAPLSQVGGFNSAQATPTGNVFQ